MHITMVKKILEDGSPCRKCVQVDERIDKDGVRDQIHETIVADMRDPDSEGLKLAQQFKVERAPFFIVKEDGKKPQIYTVYFQLVKEVLNR